MSPRPTDTRAAAFARGFAGLGAPVGAARCMVIDGREEGLQSAVAETLAPREIVSSSTVLPEASAEAGDFDLIVATGVLGAGDIASALSVALWLAQRLGPSGSLAAAVDCFAAPVTHEGVGREDPVLFPDLGALGLLGGEAEHRTALTPASWLSLLSRAGLQTVAVAGYGDEPLPSSTLSDHARRLEPFEPREIGTGRLLVLARRTGVAA